MQQPEVRAERAVYVHEWNVSEHGRSLKASHVLSPAAASRRAARNRSPEARARAATWYRENHDRALEVMAERRKSDAYQTYRAAYLEQYKQRPEAIEKIRAQGRKHAQRRLALSRALPATLTIEEWAWCLDYFDFRCVYCGDRPLRLEQDHFVPLERGGPYTASNIVCACRSCNSRKRDVPPEEWCDSDTYGRVMAYFMTLEGSD